MSTGPVATATVRIVPDTTGFRAALEAELAVATKGVSATAAAGIAQSSGTASAALAKTARASKTAEAGLLATKNESNALRGALIGLSRVTPVTVFGLGVYGTAAIAAGLAVKSALTSTADLEHELNVFQATTGATAEQMKRVSVTAIALGGDLTLPNTSAGDAAKAMTELAKAGLSVNDTLAASRGVLQLAAAAQIDEGQAADYVATALNAFGLAGKDASHVADLLAGASNAAQGSITDFGTAFQQVSAVARQTHLSLETTTGALTELAKAGLRGADGGTSLRTTLLRLTPTTKQAAQYQAALGIQLDKSLPIGKQLGDVIDQYRRALTALTPIQQQQALAQIFGQDAIRAASILIRGGSEALDDNTRAANQNGAAAALAQANAKGLSGAFAGLKNNLDTLGIKFGNVAKGPLTAFVNELASSVDLLGKGADAAGHYGSEVVKLGKRINNALPGSGFAHTLFHTILPDLTTLGPLRLAQAVDKHFSGPSFGPEDVLPIDRDTNQGARQASNRARGVGRVGGLSDEERAAIQRRVAALALAKANAKKNRQDIAAPLDLQNNQFQAELNGNLQQELSADKAIENYFEQRLKSAVKGTARYTRILQAEVAAHQATASVQSQIDSEAKAARQAALEKAKQEAADAKARRIQIFNLDKSRLDLAIQEAGLTKTKLDDIRTNRAEITFFQRQIKRIEAIKKRRKLTLDEQQALVDYRSAIVSLLSTIQDIKKKKKDKSGSGFTLEDLFKESASELSEFGSNVSTGVTLGGGARAAIAGAISAHNPHLSAADRAKLLATGRTNDLLAEILAEISRQSTSKGEKNKSKATVRDLGGGVSYATDARSRGTAKRVRNG